MAHSKGETVNTVILNDYDSCLSNSCGRRGSSLPHRKLGSRLCLNGALLAPTATTLRFRFPELQTHLCEYACSCLRGKCSGLGLFALI